MKVFWQTYSVMLIEMLVMTRNPIKSYRAYVVPFSCVGGRVSLQVRLLHECLSTVGAHKLLLALVVPKMVLERDNFGHMINYWSFKEVTW